MEILGAKWNGEPCKAESVTVLLKRVKNMPYCWQNEFDGQRIEAIKITINDTYRTTFFIANEDGQGYKKITEYQGMWYGGHKSVFYENEMELEVGDLDSVTMPKEK